MVAGKVRTLKAALERRIGARIGASRAVLKWMVEHAGNMITRFQVGQDGGDRIQEDEGKRL